MNGRGLGSILSGIGRTILPLLKAGGKALLKQGARTGLQVASDVISGQDIKSALKQRGQDAGKQLLYKAVGALSGGAPPGEPLKKRIKLSTTRGSTQKKKTRGKRKTHADIFA